MKRENKAYSFKEQIIELELKEVSTGVHLQEPVRPRKTEATDSLCVLLSSPALPTVLCGSPACFSPEK